MDHQRWIADLKAYLDGELDSARTRAVEDHLQSCSDCREELNALADASWAVALSAEAEPSPALRARIVERYLASQSTRRRKVPGWGLGLGFACAAAALLISVAPYFDPPTETSETLTAMQSRIEIRGNSEPFRWPNQRAVMKPAPTREPCEVRTYNVAYGGSELPDTGSLLAQFHAQPLGSNTFLVAPEHADAFLGALRGLGTASIEEKLADRTVELNDLTGRIESLRLDERDYRGELGRATTVSEVARLDANVGRIREQIARLTSQRESLRMQGKYVLFTLSAKQ